nr:MAG TPA: hypothetical protein [Caudoviricetes sp.]
MHPRALIRRLPKCPYQRTNTARQPKCCTPECTWNGSYSSCMPECACQVSKRQSQNCQPKVLATTFDPASLT